MHPDLQRALAQARHADLLRQHQRYRRDRPTTQLTRAGHASPTGPPRTHRARRSLGVALVAAGQRLLQGMPAAADVSESRR